MGELEGRVTASRRSAWLMLASSLVVSNLSTPASHAEDAEPSSSLPKAYQLVVRNVIKNMRDAINAEAEGASELEVRRKADPAKASVMEFVRKWRDNSRVSEDPSHVEITSALRELGQYYQKNGQRVALTRPVAEGVLSHLAAAEAALPPADEKDKFMGVF